MSLFNSLGSNYDASFVWQSLLAKNSPRHTEQLTQYLTARYSGQVTFTYKGREALSLGLKLLRLPPGSLVAITGFTCYAVYQAVVAAGYQVVYLDITAATFNFSASALKRVLNQYPRIKAVIVQNTLGYPCDIEGIAKTCHDNSLVLIEDLAHSVGATYTNGKEAGTVGDLTVLSFSQHKIIDGISGGALIVRNKAYLSSHPSDLLPVSWRQQLLDRFYPLFTYLIRTSYDLKIGKLLHAVLKLFSLLSQPMGKTDQLEIHALPPWYCYLAYLALTRNSADVQHRRAIASIYAQNLPSSIVSEFSTSLRFPIFISHRHRLIKFLEAQGIYISDIWYDAPIAPQKYLHATTYRHQCPQAETIAATIINLPTHRNISPAQAQILASFINQWLKSS